MIFVQAHPQAVPPAIEQIGAVQYVMWHPVKCGDKKAFFLYPNGAELKTGDGRERFVSMAETPQEAWDKIVLNKGLLQKYGIPT